MSEDTKMSKGEKTDGLECSWALSKACDPVICFSTLTYLNSNGVVVSWSHSFRNAYLRDGRAIVSPLHLTSEWGGYLTLIL